MRGRLDRQGPALVGFMRVRRHYRHRDCSMPAPNRTDGFSRCSTDNRIYSGANHCTDAKKNQLCQGQGFFNFAIRYFFLVVVLTRSSKSPAKT